jgi:transcriptional regulator with XRE-family HTH domain
MRNANSATDQASMNGRIGRAVAAAMKARGAKGTEIARLLAISSASLSARLNGHTPFRADQLLVIGDYLGVDAGQFLSDAPVLPLSGQVEHDFVPSEWVDMCNGQLTLQSAA